MTEEKKKGYFYTKNYRCLYCRRSFPGYRMYPSAMERFEKLDSYFDIPVYDSKPDDFSNYLQIEVKVCPGCFYASNDDAHFTVERTPGEPFQPTSQEVQAVQGAAEMRRRLASAAKDLGAFPRSIPDALVSYGLAIHSSNTLFNADPRRNAVEAARMANCALKCAQLYVLNGPPERVDDWRRKAMDYLGKAFELEVKGALRYRILYQLGAIAIYYGEDKIASRCFQALSDVVDTGTSRDLTRYLERLRRIWQDRDLNRHPSVAAAAPPAPPAAPA